MDADSKQGSPNSGKMGENEKKEGRKEVEGGKREKKGMKKIMLKGVIDMAHSIL